MTMQDQHKDKRSPVTIASYWYPTEAWIAQNRLAAEGIQASVVNEQLVSMNWLYANAVGGVKLQVVADDAERAMAALSEIQSQTLPSPTQNDTSFGIEKCPQCGSTEFSRGTYWRRAIFASMLFLGFPIPIRRRSKVCLDCEYREKTHPLQFSIKDLLVLMFLVALAFGYMRMSGQTWMSNVSKPVAEKNR